MANPYFDPVSRKIRSSLNSRPVSHESDAFLFPVLPLSFRLVWGLLLFIGFALSPESPSYFAKKGRFDDSKKALARLRGIPIDSPEIEAAFEAIRVRQAAEASLGDSTYRELFSMKDR